MPNEEVMMTSKIFTHREWLTFYLNTWKKNTTARMIDVMTDMINKETDPEMVVEDGAAKQEIPVALRLEMRKALVVEALLIAKSAETLLKKSDEELVAFISEDALKTDAAVIEKYVPGASAPAEENKPAEETQPETPKNVDGTPAEKLPEEEKVVVEEVKKEGEAVAETEATPAQ